MPKVTAVSPASLPILSRAMSATPQSARGYSRPDLCLGNVHLGTT